MNCTSGSVVLLWAVFFAIVEAVEAQKAVQKPDPFFERKKSCG
jgi:hypothetical protein